MNPLLRYSPVVPSVCYLYYGIYRFLSTHPLLNSPLVYDPVTNTPISISQYRFMAGIPVNPGLTCSIYPGFSSLKEVNSPSPATISASVLYSPYDLGSTGTDQVCYHFVLEYMYQTVTVDGLDPSSDPNLIHVPANYSLSPQQDPFNNTYQTKTTSLYLSPGLDVISNYLELTRLAIVDMQHHQQYPLSVPPLGTIDKVETIHIDFPTIDWNNATSVAFYKGYLLIRLTGWVTRDWRKMHEYSSIVKGFNLTTNMVTP